MATSRNTKEYNQRHDAPVVNPPHTGPLSNSEKPNEAETAETDPKTKVPTAEIAPRPSNRKEYSRWSY